MQARGGGWIINISSLAGKNPFVGGAAYCASKAGLNAFSEALMQEVRHDDIRVSYVLPGSVATGFGDRGASGEADWKLAPEDVARVVVDLIAHPPRSLPSRVELRPSRPSKEMTTAMMTPSRTTTSSSASGKGAGRAVPRARHQGRPDGRAEDRLSARSPTTRTACRACWKTPGRRPRCPIPTSPRSGTSARPTGSLPRLRVRRRAAACARNAGRADEPAPRARSRRADRRRRRRRAFPRHPPRRPAARDHHRHRERQRQGPRLRARALDEGRHGPRQRGRESGRVVAGVVRRAGLPVAGAGASAARSIRGPTSSRSAP